MTGGLRDLRFEGFSNEQLAGEIDGLRNGAGSGSLHRAVHALMSIADALADTDRTLRQELQKIGVEWEGAASERGHEETQKASIYAEDAVPVVARSASGVNEQGDTFSHSRNSAPNSDTLRGPTQLNGWDRFAGAFGHTTDNAQKVQDTQAARGQAIGSLNDYQRGSQSALDNHENLPVPPGMGLVSQSTSPQGMTEPQGFQGTQGSYTPTGGGSGSGGGTTTGPFGQGYQGVVPPGGGGGQQGPGGGQGNPLPGRITGTGPVPGVPGMPTGGAPGLPGRPFPIGLIADAGMAAGLATAAGGGAAAGSSLPKDRVVRGGKAAADGPDGRAARGGGAAGAADGPDGRAARGASALAGVPDEQARAARAAERIGGGGNRSGSSLMSPAAGSAPGEEDEEHVRKYGIDSDDVFGDERLVIDAVLGGEDDEAR